MQRRQGFCGKNKLLLSYRPRDGGAVRQLPLGGSLLQKKMERLYTGVHGLFVLRCRELLPKMSVGFFCSRMR